MKININCAWEPEDFNGSGMVLYSKQNKQLYLVGYIKGPQNGIFISEYLTDGWSRWFHSKEELADHLNNKGYYIPATKEEILEQTNKRVDRKIIKMPDTSLL